jgi:hypothetical protein
MIQQCPCGFATDDQLWFTAHQAQHVLRPHDVSGLTTDELLIAKRQLAVSLGLSRPGSPALVPINARMQAIESELERRGRG